METTVSTAQTVKLQFDMQTRLFNNVLEGITEPQSKTRASETVNHVKWLAGHLTATRYGFKDMAGIENVPAWTEMFSHGNGINPEANYPDIDTIKAAWNNVSGQLSNALGNLPEEALDGEGSQTPIGDNSLRGFLAFMMHHEAYHLGQLGILRKYIGHEAMKYD